jgi:serine protease Do
MKTKRIGWVLMTLSVGLVIGLCVAAGFNMPQQAHSQAAKQEQPVIAQPKAVPSLDSLRMEDAVINVADTAGKAVVSITAEHVAKIPGAAKRFYFRSPEGNSESPFSEDDNFSRFFDDFFGEIPDREYKQVGVGSGVIIDPRGYILTNQHVIDDADKLSVVLPDGREFKGEVKGQDSRSDLAIVKIDAMNLPVAVLGDSDCLRIGQWVVAIGNPFGFSMQNPEPTVTAGVISALHRTLGRTLSRSRDYNDLIQTDAAINPGNSGGPLVNLKGEIVGINVAIFSTSGGSQGIGFAIPSNNAKRIISRLIEGKKVQYGWLGIAVQDLSDDLVKYFKLSGKNGSLVIKVLKDSPAEKSGIKANDVISRFDNTPINTVKELLSAVNKVEVGKKVKVTLIRDKKDLTLDVTVEERPADQEDAEPGAVEQAKPGAWRGIDIAGLDSQSARKFRLRDSEGVVVISVQPNSSADDAGIVPGDVILEVNKQPVSDSADFKKAVQGLKGDVLVSLNRGYVIIKEKSEK